MKGTTRAFTLIELLIVVTIIAILAAIAVPGLLQAQTKSKVAKVKADMRSVSVALESYYLDYNKYPECAADFDGRVGLRMITTPIAYISGDNLFDIYFGMNAANNFINMYSYAARDAEGTVEYLASNRSARWYMLTSNGPNVTLDAYETLLDTDNYPAFLNTAYDPTNGIVSPGNLYRSGGLFMGPGKDAGFFAHAGDHGS